MYKPTTLKEEKIMNKLLSEVEWFFVKGKGVVLNATVFEPKKLSEEEKQVLFSEVYFVGLSAFIQNPSKAMEEDIYNHLFNEDRLYLVLNKSLKWGMEDVNGARVIAFLSTRDIGKNLYISGICVDPAYQGMGIGQELMNHAIKQKDYEFTSLRTQNPVMKEAFDRAIGGQSHPNGNKPPEEILDEADKLAKTLRTKNYQRDKMTCQFVYGSCLYGIEPTSKTAYYEKKFREIDKQQGDSILCVKKL